MVILGLKLSKAKVCSAGDYDNLLAILLPYTVLKEVFFIHKENVGAPTGITTSYFSAGGP